MFSYLSLKDLSSVLVLDKYHRAEKQKLLPIVFGSSWTVRNLLASVRVPILVKMKMLTSPSGQGRKGLLMIRDFDDASGVIMWAACHGYTDVVEKVSSYCRREDLNYTLGLASANGVSSVVKKLLEVRSFAP